MTYNDFKTAHHEYDECVSKGICSVNPALSSIQEVILLYIKELAYYFLKLQELGADNPKIQNDIIHALASISCNADYSQDEFSSIIMSLNNDISQCKSLYIDLCQRNNIEYELLKTYFKHGKDFSISEALRRAEKYILKRNQILTDEQKHLADTVLFLIKSLCIKHSELNSFGIEYPDACRVGLSALSFLNFLEKESHEFKEEIQKFIVVLYELVRRVHRARIEAFGEPDSVAVSFSTRIGKAILVSGTDLKELELVLQATEGKDIDVYTHGLEMILAHSYPKFQQYKHLVGHYGALDNFMLDFSTFPGAILMTKNALHKVEFLYRGRLFTTDALASRGVMKIKNHDFSQLIKSAQNAKGFLRGHQRSSVTVGYNETLVLGKINKIVDKLLTGEIKHLFIIGMTNYAYENKEYFQSFCELVPKDCYVISLGYNIEGENILHIDSYFDYTLFYQILKKMSDRQPLSEYDLSVFITKCDKHVVANAINIKNLGVKNLFMCKCSPTLINPALVQSMRTLFEIHELSNPHADLRRCLEG